MADVPVEDIAVGERGHQEGAEPKSPVRMRPRERYTVAVAPGVGGVVPRRIVEQSPVHELEPRAVGVAVLIEVVGDRQLADFYFHPAPVLGPRQLVRRARSGITIWY